MPRPKWDRQTALAMGERGREALRARRLAMRQTSALAVQLAHEPAYLQTIQAQVRAQVQVLLTRLAEESSRTHVDGAKLDRLASALERLAELERVLDGRPAPGTRRPTEVREESRSNQAPPRPVPIRSAHAPPAPAVTLQPGNDGQAAAQPRTLAEPPDF